MAKLDLIYFDAGGGHRAAATALKQAFAESHPHWQTRLMHLQEEMSSFDVFRMLTGTKMEDIYNLVLRKGWTLGSKQLLVVMQLILRIHYPFQVRRLKQYWSTGAPDIAISLVPNFNRSIYASLQAVSPKTKMVSILTDLADYPPHFWIERNQNQYFICGTSKAEQQALEMGHPRDRVFRVSGMVLNPRFYQPIEINIAAERAKLGLDPNLPTALIMFGGYGSAVMAKIARLLEASNHKLQLIFICGKSTQLKQRLESMRLKLPHFIEGFTTQVPYYMKLSDFFIGKPGPGSISEAIHLGLPVITTCNALTLPQEIYNTEWLVENELGIKLPNFGHIERGVAEMLSPGTLARYQANARKMNNRAVFEIPQIIDKLLQ
jgi:hypothetical protein